MQVSACRTQAATTTFVLKPQLQPLPVSNAVADLYEHGEVLLSYHTDTRNLVSQACRIAVWTLFAATLTSVQWTGQSRPHKPLEDQRLCACVYLTAA